jgi:transcription elongation factor Elf1
MYNNKNIKAKKRVYCPHCTELNFGFVVYKNNKVSYSICNFCGKCSDLP